jgi:tungstate transport system substrate-binding protein
VRRLAAAVAIVAVSTACGTGDRVVMAAGTTLVDSGFIEAVLEHYPGDADISVVGMSSVAALNLGGAGAADIMITHLPDAEEAFLADHPGVSQSAIFTSFFVLIGPDAAVAGADVIGSLQEIAGRQLLFVSRADGSGTAAKEAELWDLAGIDPRGQPWYIETGQGMGFTLQIADQRRAFTLAEVGAVMAFESITLQPVIATASDLPNPYTVTLAPGASPAAGEVFEWLTGPEGLEAIRESNLELFSVTVYAPASP